MYIFIYIYIYIYLYIDIYIYFQFRNKIIYQNITICIRIFTVFIMIPCLRLLYCYNTEIPHGCLTGDADRYLYVYMY